MASSLDHIFLALLWILSILTSCFLILTWFAMWRGPAFSKPSNPGFLFNSPSLNLRFFSHILLEALRNQVALSGGALEISLGRTPSLLGTHSTFHTTAGNVKLCSTAAQGSLASISNKVFFLTFSSHRQPPKSPEFSSIFRALVNFPYSSPRGAFPLPKPLPHVRVLLQQRFLSRYRNLLSVVV